MTAADAPRHSSVRYCGRDFTPADLHVIAQLAAALPSRAAISRTVCDVLSLVDPGRAAQGHDRGHQHALLVKYIYLYPQHRNWRQILTTPPSQ